MVKLWFGIVGRGYEMNVGRGYVIHNSELINEVGQELLGQLKIKREVLGNMPVCQSKVSN